MRKILAIALSTTLLTAVPVVQPSVAEAASIFEKLFPRAAERRQRRLERRFERRRLQRQRDLDYYDRQALRERRRTRSAKPLKKQRVASASYRLYSARPMRKVRLTKLANAFSAYNQKEQAAAVLRRESFIRDQLVGKRVSLDSLARTLQSLPKPGNKVRLASGASLLGAVSVSAKPGVEKAVVAHYSKAPQFLWVGENGQPTAKARAMEDVLAQADDYGLRAGDYLMAPSSASSSEGEEALKKAMRYEFGLTARALRYLNDARHGLVDPNRISGYHDFKGNRSDYGKLLTELSQTDTPEQMLLAAHPKDPAFEAMRQELTALRAKADLTDVIVVASGTFIRPGQSNPELANIVELIRRKSSPELRSRHFDVFGLDHSQGEYGPQVVEMVRDFQRSVNLKPDGIVGKNTIARMQMDNPKVQINKVLYAMERLRWHPDQLGNTHVFINQPAYRATYIREGRPHLSMKAIVGKTSNQTNFFHDTIEYVEFNPYWGVPRSILVNEMLPKLRRNPGYLDNLGYEITTVRGTPISSWSVDWYNVGSDFPFNVRQPPGPKNALGELKIMFPNKHSIYMHDTPSRSLFKRSQRALSHGCVRLAEPHKMAAAVLGTSIDKVSSKVRAGGNRRQNVKSKIPVYVAYFTAWPDAKGKMSYFGDIYGRDKALQKAMAAEARARAEGA